MDSSLKTKQKTESEMNKTDRGEERWLVLVESLCPHNRQSEFMLGWFPDLISKMVSCGVRVTNQNAGQGVRMFIGNTYRML